MKSLVSTCLLLMSISVGATSLDLIELIDGSSLSGEVMSFDGNTYTIRTKTLGVVKLPRSGIVAIRSGNAAIQHNQQVIAGGEEMQAIQSMLQGNPDTMNSILQLQNDPQIQQILSDPELMRAIRSNNFGALQNNPQIKALLNNPTIKSLTQQVR